MGMQFFSRQAEPGITSMKSRYFIDSNLPSEKEKRVGNQRKQRREPCVASLKFSYADWRCISIYTYVQFGYDAALTTYGRCLADRIKIQTQKYFKGIYLYSFEWSSTIPKQSDQ